MLAYATKRLINRFTKGRVFPRNCGKKLSISRSRQKQVAKIVHCGLHDYALHSLGSYALMLGTRSDLQI